MCIICERELWGEHRALEGEFFKPCKTCNKFLAPALREPAITASQLAARSTSVLSARANHGAKNFWRPRTRSKAQTSCWSRSSHVLLRLGCRPR